MLLLTSSPLWAQQEQIDTLVAQGVKHHDQGEYQQALEVFQQALNLDPKSAQVKYEMALTYLELEDYQTAEKLSKKVAETKNEHRLSGYLTYGASLDLQGKSKQSIKVYEKAIDQFNHYLLYYNHAVSCINADQVDKALNSVVQAIELNKGHASSHLLLSKIMEQRSVRIKTMLPLYYFLLLEPNSQRSALEYKILRKHLATGVSKSDEGINLQLSMPSEADQGFGAAELMISLSQANNNLEENQGKSDLKLFSENNELIFSVLGELNEEKSGIFWEFYVPFFNRLVQNELVEVYSYYISLSLGEEAIGWFESHQLDFDRFKEHLDPE